MTAAMRIVNSLNAFNALLCCALLAIAVAPRHASAADLYVIAHPGMQLSAEAIRDVYIGEKQFAGDVKLIPVDNASAQADFLGKVLRLDQTRYANLWVKKSFRDALNPPALRNGDKEVVDFVIRTPGAVSYIGSNPPAGVTVLQKF
jgi:hypothetical protein